MNWPIFVQEPVNLPGDNTFLIILKICLINQDPIKCKAILFHSMPHTTITSLKPTCTPSLDFYRLTQQASS